MGLIVSQNNIGNLVDNLRQQNKKIVTINGSFDLLHKGHLHMLERAKKQGDVLIVGLNSDASVKSNKGPSRPINPENDRALFLSSLIYVDYVVLFNETTPLKLLEEIKPDVHVNGADYGEDCIEKPVVEKYGGKIHIVDFIGGCSSTKMIDKLVSTHTKGKKVVFLDRDKTINKDPGYIYKTKE